MDEVMLKIEEKLRKSIAQRLTTLDNAPQRLTTPPQRLTPRTALLPFHFIPHHHPHHGHHHAWLYRAARCCCWCCGSDSLCTPSSRLLDFADKPFDARSATPSSSRRTNSQPTRSTELHRVLVHATHRSLQLGPANRRSQDIPTTVLQRLCCLEHLDVRLVD
jgi:hypothetical protein